MGDEQSLLSQANSIPMLYSQFTDPAGAASHMEPGSLINFHYSHDFICQFQFALLTKWSPWLATSQFKVMT